MTLHEQLSEKWELCKFGVKQRVFKDNMPQTTVQYILSNPKYGDNNKMEWLIDCIEKHTKEFADEVNKMKDSILTI